MKVIVCKISFCLLFLLTTNFVKNSDIYSRISFIFLKNVLNQIWNAFNTKFWHQSKDQKSNYQVGEAFAFFCKLIAVTLGWNSVKSFSIAKSVKEDIFEGVWDEFPEKNGFQRQSVTKYQRLTLVFLWIGTPQEKFNCYISWLFC